MITPEEAAPEDAASDGWILPVERPALTGDEAFEGINASVTDFWRFAMSDLRMNNARGYLAEFLVARALGLDDVQRVEWDAYDLLVDDRIRVEVKSSAYLQAWEQPRLSRITFSGLRGTRYDPRHGEDPGGRQLNAHVYVFGVQVATDPETVDPIDVAHWEFYVLSKSDIEGGGVGQGLGLATLTRLASGPTSWAELGTRVLGKAEGQTVNTDPRWCVDTRCEEFRGEPVHLRCDGSVDLNGPRNRPDPDCSRPRRDRCQRRRATRSARRDIRWLAGPVGLLACFADE